MATSDSFAPTIGQYSKVGWFHTWSQGDFKRYRPTMFALVFVTWSSINAHGRPWGWSKCPFTPLIVPLSKWPGTSLRQKLKADLAAHTSSSWLTNSLVRFGMRPNELPDKYTQSSFRTASLSLSKMPSKCRVKWTDRSTKENQRPTWSISRKYSSLFGNVELISKAP